jgi:hypothetical protein
MRRGAGQLLIISPLASAVRRLSLQFGQFRQGTLSGDELALASLTYLEGELLALSPVHRAAVSNDEHTYEEILRAVLVARTVLELTGLRTVFLRSPSVLDGFVGNYLKIPVAPAPSAYMME